MNGTILRPLGKLKSPEKNAMEVEKQRLVAMKQIALAEMEKTKLSEQLAKLKRK
jgi:hypothetical protein